MSDWPFLNHHRIRTGLYDSTPEDGFNGVFAFSIPGEARKILCVASDGLGWQQVSVSFGPGCAKVPPYWVLCAVKDLFWEPEDWVVHFFPAESEKVNIHPGCLHLWRSTDPAKPQPIPLSIMVGPKELSRESV